MIKQFHRFATNRDGSAAMVFGLAFIPVILMSGVVIDYSRASITKSALQQATDNVALTVAPGLTPTSDLSSAKARASILLRSNNRFVGATVVDATISTDKKTFCFVTSFRVPTLVMQIAQVNSMTLQAKSCASLSNSSESYEIALVLDNSGSMNQSVGGVSKMQALKIAATNFVSGMFGRLPGKVKIAITPFSGLVIPVDPTVTSNRALPWIDVNGLSSQHWLTLQNKAQANAAGFTSRFDIFGNLKTQRADWDFGGCYEPQPYPMNVTETVPSSADPETLFIPYFAPDEPDVSPYENNYLNDDGGGCSSASTANWTDLTRACKYLAPTGWTSGAWSWYGSTAGNGWSGGSWSSRGGAFNGPNGMCPDATTQTVLQLTPNQTALTGKLNQLVAAGDTNLHEGFMWGWRSISPNPPFSAGSGYNAASLRKIIVMMTDGYNNWSSNPNTVGGSYYEALGYYSYNSQKNIRLPDGSRGDGVDYQMALKAAANKSTDYKATSRLAQDELTAESCENAKATGVEIYTIGFSVSTAPIDAAGINLLKKCASNSDHYFVATNATEIDRVFSRIANNVHKLRLTQ